MAEKKKVDVIDKLYGKLGRVSYLMAQSEGALRRANEAHQALVKEATAIANQITQAEAKDTGD